MTAAKRTAPISSHPAFKWAVGAWFALLLGLGLFVMPAAIHQMLADRLGLSGVFDSTTAIRAMLSLGAALIGLAVGVTLALRVAAINEASSDDADDADEGSDGASVWLDDEADKATPAPAKPDAPRRPFNPREDLAEPGIASFEGAARAGLLSRSSHEQDFVLEEVETAANDPYFAEEWEEPIAEAKNDEVWEELPDLGQITGEAEPVGASETPDETDEAPAEEAEFEEPAEPEAEVDMQAEPPAEALGDLSLDALTERLGAALAAFKAGPAENDDSDPVIAFLRREAERETPEQGPDRASGDPQAELRSALDKLSRVGKPK
ncbi:MAG: hypothetical protein AB3N06_06135 [Erythrobacter sp.]